MRYVIARIKTNVREVAYRNYVTDCLFALVNGGFVRGYQMSERYCVMMAPKQPEKVDNRTQQEIVHDIWAGINGKKRVNK